MAGFTAVFALPSKDRFTIFLNFARKYNQITPEGKFLDPLADKILVSSAFISFASLGIIEFWMVGLIIFRDLFVTGLRMVIEHRGLSMVTSMIAKTKTTVQYIIIIFTLIELIVIQIMILIVEVHQV